MNSVPPAVEIQHIDRMLARLETDRAWLLARRAQLVAELGRGAGTGAPSPAGNQWTPSAAGAEAKAPTVQNVLLGLGGVLLAVAVTAFTVVSWGDMGTAGRAAVLALLTLAAMATPVVLLRRALTATAEVVGCLALVLLLLDAYALRVLAFPSVGWAAYAAGASAVLAAVWGGYGWALGRHGGRTGTADGPGDAGTSEGPGAAAHPADPAHTPRPAGSAAAPRGLRLPLPLAVLLAQLPLLLWAVAASAGAAVHAGALIATAGLDVLVARRCRIRGASRTAGVAAAVTACLGTFLALGLSLSASGPADAAPDSAALLAASAVALAAVLLPSAAGPAPQPAAGVSALRRAGVWWAALCGGAAVAAAGGMLRTVLPGDWAVVGYTVCATALLVAVHLARERRPLFLGLAAAAAAGHAAVLLWALPAVAVAIAGPVGWTGAVWTGAPEGAAAAVSPRLTWPGSTAVPVVLATSAVAALAVARRAAETRHRAAAACTAVVLGAACTAVVPPALDLALPVALGLLVALTAVLLLASATLSCAPAALTAAVCAVTVGASVACWSLAEEPLTPAALGALLLAFTAVAAAPAGGRLQPVTACAAAVSAAGLAASAALSLGLPARLTAFVLLPVAAATAYLAARLRERPAGLALECTGYAVVVAAVATAVGDATVLATALALAGVIAAGTALRADRRRSAAAAATALFVVAAWVRLAGWGVEAPEAYTLPVTVPALALGCLRRRRDSRVRSWAAYGPGLAATLLPSLAAAWGDEHWLRPLLLGPAALAVTLAGARWRLQAPLLLGGGTVALLAGHELAPYVVQVVDGLPRWLPPALAGALLLALGTTYEQRLRDARRIRAALGRLQ